MLVSPDRRTYHSRPLRFLTSVCHAVFPAQFSLESETFRTARTGASGFPTWGRGEEGIQSENNTDQLDIITSFRWPLLLCCFFICAPVGNVWGWSVSLFATVAAMLCQTLRGKEFKTALLSSSLKSLKRLADEGEGEEEVLLIMIAIVWFGWAVIWPTKKIMGWVIKHNFARLVSSVLGWMNRSPI